MSGLRANRLRGRLQPLARWVERRLDSRRDGGFILLESIIAIAVVAVVMTALTAEFVSNVANTSQLRTQQGAIQVADSTIDQLRSLHASDLVTGRDQADVATQYAAAPNSVKQWLYSLSNQAYDPKAVAPAGATAAVPTSVTIQKPSTVGYSVYEFLQQCAVVTSSTAGCVAQSTVGNAPATSYLQAVVAVTWPSGNCGASQCTYVTSTLFSPAADPTFRINSVPYAAPQIVDPGALTNAVNDQVNLQLKLATGTGVPSFSWTLTAGSLPPGLTMNGSGLITGTITGSAGSYSATVQVQDQFQRTDTQVVTWTVEAPLTIAAVNSQTNFVADKPTVTLTASGGGGSGYTFSDPNSTLPAGLTISTGGVITGTVQAPAPKVYKVSITATDPQACQNCATSSRTAVTTFQWSVNYPPLATNAPGSQTSTVGSALAGSHVVQMTATGGDGAYAWSASGLPAGVSVNASTGAITGTPSAAGTYSTTVTVSDPTAGVTASSTSFTWTVFAAPTMTTPPAQTSSVGAVVSVNLRPSCPNSPCTYALTGAPSNLTVTSAGVISGTVGGGAANYPSVTVTMTDNSGATTTTSFAWTVYAAPTIAMLGAKSVTAGIAYSTPAGYTCPFTSCTISLSGSVPGLGLTTAAGSTADNSAATRLTMSSTSGTVYISGTVQSAATAGGATTSYAPRLTITSPDSVTPSVTAPTWTAYAQPTIGTLSVHGSTETALDSVAVPYTCPTSSCSLQLSGSVPGVGLSLTASKQGDNSAATTLAVTASSGTVYLTGTVQTSAVTGTATTKAYTPSLTIADGNGFTSAPATAAWTAYVAPGITSPGTQTNDVGDVVSVSTAPSCPNGPCTYTWTLPSGLGVANGIISGTVAQGATSTTASVVVKDADGATATTGSFTWTIYAKPSVTGLVTKNVTVGAAYNGSAATAITYSCPRVNCTISLANAVPGTGLSASSTGSAAGSLTVTSATGTVYVVGTVAAGAVPNGSSSNAYNESLSITDGGSITTSSSATWTAYAAPTVARPPNPHAVSVGALDNVGVAYTCPNATCTISLAGSVPGIGLSTTANLASNNTATSVTVTALSGTVYLTGIVQSSAVTNGTSKAWTPSLTITDNGVYSSSASSATWTAYPAPTATSLPAKTVAVGTVDNTAIAYTCPTKTCQLTLAGAYPGVGLSTTANQPGNNSAATVLPLTATSGTVYITGTVQSTAVSGASSQSYSPTLTLTDGGSFSSSSTNTWTVTTKPSWSAPATVTAPWFSLTYSQDVTGWVTGGAAGTRTYTASNLPTGLSMSSSGTVSGLPYVKGSWTTTLTVTDSAGSSASTTIVWKVA